MSRCLDLIHPVLRGAHWHLLSHLWPHPHLWVVVLQALWHVLHRAGILSPSNHQTNEKFLGSWSLLLFFRCHWTTFHPGLEEERHQSRGQPVPQVFLNARYKSFKQMLDCWFHCFLWKNLNLTKYFVNIEPTGVAQSSQLISWSRVSPVPGAPSIAIVLEAVMVVPF